MIDLNSVITVASNSACLSFPRSASLSHFGITPGDMQIRTGNTDSWPEVAEPRNGRDGQAATLWGFRLINGQWYAAGIERLRKYQLNGSKPVAEPRYGGLGTVFGDGWCEKADFGVLSHNNPKPGEPVGFCVVAGDSRLGFNCPFQARTEIIVCAWPDATGAQPLQVLWREGQSVQAPEPIPTPEPVPTPSSPVPPPIQVPVPGDEMPLQWGLYIEAHLAQLGKIEQAMNRVAENVDRLVKAWTSS